MAKNAIKFLRISLGIIFFWFGFLKFFHGVSSAETLATKTISVLTFGLIEPSVSLIILAVWETMIGLGLLFNKFLREILLLLFLQMIGTITPLFFFPAETFKIFPFVPTLEGQYIIKNLILISAGLAIGATVRGGKIISETGKQKNQINLTVLKPKLLKCQT
ncbi:MAG: DoxX family membrane protein [Ignavibacteriales bacterium]|nr:DoxX family membrane protein [Ignavibacteriales bacterium]